MVIELDEWRAGQVAGAEAWPWSENAFPTAHDRAMLRQLGYLDDEENAE
jgi:hypothetical protein